MTRAPRWVVLNQSQNEPFQRFLADLTGDLGACLLLCGNPFPPTSKDLTVVRGPRYRRGSLLARALSWVAFLVRAATASFLLRGSPLMVATTNPPFLPHLVWLVARLRGRRYVLLVWDLYPEHLVQAGLTRRSNALVRLWRALNVRAFAGAEAVVAPGESMAEAIRAQMGGRPARVVVIPGWVDVERIRPVDKQDNPFAVQFGGLDELTVMYSGNLGATHGTGAIADIAGLLSDESRVRFVVVGDGLGLEGIRARVAERGLTNVSFLPFQPEELFPLSQAAADVALVLQAPGTEHLSVPSKTYSSLAAGNAVLAMTAPGSDLARLVEESGAGAACPSTDVGAAAEVIRGWLRDPARLAAARASARRVAEERFSVQAARARFTGLLAPAIGRAEAT